LQQTSQWSSIQKRESGRTTEAICQSMSRSPGRSPIWLLDRGSLQHRCMRWKQYLPESIRCGGSRSSGCALRSTRRSSWLVKDAGLEGGQRRGCGGVLQGKDGQKKGPSPGWVFNDPKVDKTLTQHRFALARVTTDSASNPRVVGSAYWGGVQFSVTASALMTRAIGAALTRLGGGLATAPSLDAVSEFKIDSNNQKAEFEASVSYLLWPSLAPLSPKAQCANSTANANLREERPLDWNSQAAVLPQWIRIHPRGPGSQRSAFLFLAATKDCGFA